MCTPSSIYRTFLTSLSLAKFSHSVWEWIEKILLFSHLSSKVSKVKSSMTYRELTRNDKNTVSWLKMLVKLRSIFLLFNFPKMFLIIRHICLIVFWNIMCRIPMSSWIFPIHLPDCIQYFDNFDEGIKLEQGNFNQLQLLALTSLPCISVHGRLSW